MLSVFGENFKKSLEGVSRKFQWSFVAWISSQLPEQKEGFFLWKLSLTLLCCGVSIIEEGQICRGVIKAVHCG